MISAPSSLRSRGRTPLTVPAVPTGINTGVLISPCEVLSRPRLALRFPCFPGAISSLNWTRLIVVADSKASRSPAGHCVKDENSHRLRDQGDRLCLREAGRKGQREGRALLSG